MSEAWGSSLSPAIQATDSLQVVVKPGIKPKRRRTRRNSRYAIDSSKDEILLPEFTRLGYLTHSKLILAAQDGDTNAKHRVWVQNARLAFSVVNRYRVRQDLVADAFQEGQIGLDRAIEKFDVDRLNEFSTYAYRAISNHIFRFRARRSAFIPISPTMYRTYHKFRRSLARAMTRADWFDAHERWLDRDPDEYARLLRIHALASPEALPKDHGLARSSDHPSHPLSKSEFRRVLQTCIDALPPRMKQVIVARYGLLGLGEGNGQTLEQVGRDIGLTKERVRQIQIRAEEKLAELLVEKGYDHTAIT
jgi:RNA polymerase nonessential primary-like sigma factor